jgi:hypothetical protein
MKKARKFYESSSGDRWYLIRDPSGVLFIHSEANVRIPMKPDAYSEAKPDIYSVFIPDSVPI